MGLAEDLTTLADLFERGLIDRRPFEEAKARLLGYEGEAQPEEAAAEPDRRLPPTTLPPDAVELPGGPPPPSLDEEHPESGETAGDEGLEEDEKQTFRERLAASVQRHHPMFFVTLALLVVFGGVLGWTIFGPPTERQLELAQEEYERNHDAAGYRYPTERYDERAFIDAMREQFDDIDERSGEEVLEWGHEHCGWLDYWQPQDLDDYMFITSVHGDFDSEQHKQDFLSTVFIAGHTMCDEYDYIWGLRVDQ